MMGREILLRDQPESRLNEMYGKEDYYWYLRSDAFKFTFLRPMANQINQLGQTCLDIGCGEGWLSEFVDIDYLGIDASEIAIGNAVSQFSNIGKAFRVARFEEYLERHYPKCSHSFDVVVFGGILHCLVKPEHRMELLEKYRETFGVKFFVVYDLEQLDTSEIEAKYECVYSRHARAPLEGKTEIYLRRKIEVYKCQ